MKINKEEWMAMIQNRDVCDIPLDLADSDVRAARGLPPNNKKDSFDLKKTIRGAISQLELCLERLENE